MSDLFNIIDTETCSCCDDLKHERIIKSCNSLFEVIDYLIDSDYYTLLNSFKEDESESIEEDECTIIVKNGNKIYSLCEILKMTGITKEIIKSVKNNKEKVVKEWLNL